MAFSAQVNLGANVNVSIGVSVGGFRYPSDIDPSLPTMTFLAHAPRGGGAHGSVTMYMPPAVSINDGAGYSELGLGIAGAIGNVSDISKPSSGNLSTGIDNMLGSLQDRSKGDSNLAGMIAGNAVKEMAGGGAAAMSDMYSYQSGRVLNPNTVLKYDGPAIRDFSFQFQMTPKSEAESLTIRGIHGFFRKYMYPEGDEFLLSYPDIWKIRFNAGGPNMYVPNINDCFLTACALTVNPSNNSFHKNGAPNELTLSLSFRETRQNKRKDVW